LAIVARGTQTGRVLPAQNPQRGRTASHDLHWRARLRRSGETLAAGGMAPQEPDETAPAFDTAGVSVEEVVELGGKTAVALTGFQAGERVFRERALVIAAAPTNLARLRAYLALPDARRRELREEFWGEAPEVRCAATAACRVDAAGTGDSAAEVLAILRAEGHTDIELGEVEAVIRVWNLNAYDNALAPVACKVAHSCAPNVSVRVDAEAGAIEATACRPISKGDSLGSWYFQDTGLWWMGSDVRRAIFETDRGFLCQCLRCRGPDVCRATQCPACSEGTETPQGCAATPSSSTTWACDRCGRTSSGDALKVAAEAEIVPRVLLELRPPRGAAAGAAPQRATSEELAMLAASSRERLGPDHWTTAAALLVLHYRGRAASGGVVDRFSAAAGCRFLGWLVGRRLPWPPAAVVRTPVALALDCAGFFAFPPAAIPGGEAPPTAPTAASALSDGRCIAARILTDFLLPVFDASGMTVASVANTGARVDKLRAWLGELRCSCGSCGAPCGKPASASVCGKCKQVRYCSRDCQQADWKARHKAGCLPATASLQSDIAWRIITPSLT